MGDSSPEWCIDEDTGDQESRMEDEGANDLTGDPPENTTAEVPPATSIPPTSSASSTEVLVPSSSTTMDESASSENLSTILKATSPPSALRPSTILASAVPVTTVNTAVNLTHSFSTHLVYGEVPRKSVPKAQTPQAPTTIRQSQFVPIAPSPNPNLPQPRLARLFAPSLGAQRESFPCPVCSLVTTSHKELIVHLSQHLDFSARSQSKPTFAYNQNNYHCTACNLYTPHRVIFAEHVRCHTKPLPYMCGMCSLGFPSMNMLLEHHLKTHKSGGVSSALRFEMEDSPNALAIMGQLGPQAPPSNVQSSLMMPQTKANPTATPTKRRMDIVGPGATSYKPIVIGDDDNEDSGPNIGDISQNNQNASGSRALGTGTFRLFPPYPEKKTTATPVVVAQSSINQPTPVTASGADDSSQIQEAGPNLSAEQVVASSRQDASPHGGMHIQSATECGSSAVELTASGEASSPALVEPSQVPLSSETPAANRETTKDTEVEIVSVLRSKGSATGRQQPSMEVDRTSVAQLTGRSSARKSDSLALECAYQNGYFHCNTCNTKLKDIKNFKYHVFYHLHAEKNKPCSSCKQCGLVEDSVRVPCPLVDKVTRYLIEQKEKEDKRSPTTSVVQKTPKRTILPRHSPDTDNWPLSTVSTTTTITTTTTGTPKPQESSSTNSSISIGPLAGAAPSGKQVNLWTLPASVISQTMPPMSGLRSILRPAFPNLPLSMYTSAGQQCTQTSPSIQVSVPTTHRTSSSFYRTAVPITPIVIQPDETSEQPQGGVVLSNLGAVQSRPAVTTLNTSQSPRAIRPYIPAGSGLILPRLPIPRFPPPRLSQPRVSVHIRPPTPILIAPTPITPEEIRIKLEPVSPQSAPAFRPNVKQRTSTGPVIILSSDTDSDSEKEVVTSPTAPTSNERNLQVESREAGHVTLTTSVQLSEERLPHPSGEVTQELSGSAPCVNENQSLADGRPVVLDYRTGLMQEETGDASPLVSEELDDAGESNTIQSSEASEQQMEQDVEQSVATSVTNISVDTPLNVAVVPHPEDRDKEKSDTEREGRETVGDISESTEEPAEQDNQITQTGQREEDLANCATEENANINSEIHQDAKSNDQDEVQSASEIAPTEIEASSSSLESMSTCDEHSMVVPDHGEPANIAPSTDSEQLPQTNNQPSSPTNDNPSYSDTNTNNGEYIQKENDDIFTSNEKDPHDEIDQTAINSAVPDIVVPSQGGDEPVEANLLSTAPCQEEPRSLVDSGMKESSSVPSVKEGEFNATSLQDQTLLTPQPDVPTLPIGESGCEDDLDVEPAHPNNDLHNPVVSSPRNADGNKIFKSLKVSGGRYRWDFVDETYLCLKCNYKTEKAVTFRRHIWKHVHKQKKSQTCNHCVGKVSYNKFNHCLVIKNIMKVLEHIKLHGLEKSRLNKEVTSVNRAFSMLPCAQRPDGLDDDLLIFEDLENDAPAEADILGDTDEDIAQLEDNSRVESPRMPSSPMAVDDGAANLPTEHGNVVDPLKSDPATEEGEFLVACCSF